MPKLLIFTILINLFLFSVLGLTLEQCPAGYYCRKKLDKVANGDDELVRIPCPAGTFSQNGQDNCTPCGSGSYASTSGSTSCATCPAGFMCPIASQSPVPCLLNTYTSSSGQTRCNNCPAGAYTLQRGSTQCINCPLGINCPNCSTFFCDGDLLSLQHQVIVNNFAQKVNPRWKLIYKAKRDGFRSQDFHRLCDNQARTVTIIQSTNGYLFGGYTEAAWYSNGWHGNDPRAFIFTLTNPNSIPPTRYLIKGGYEQYAIYGGVNYGPIFGGGNDIYVPDVSNGTAGHTNFGHTYTDTTGKGQLTFTGNYSFLANDIEVYKLLD